jgi:hypothetical protein
MIGGHLEVAERAAALDVVHAIGDALADEVGQLLDQVGIMQQIGAAGADRERVLVAGNGTTGIRGRDWWLVAHMFPLRQRGEHIESAKQQLRMQRKDALLLSQNEISFSPFCKQISPAGKSTCIAL